MNREKVWFSFFMILALTLNFGFFYGEINDAAHHNVYELFAVIVVNLIATIIYCLGFCRTHTAYRAYPIQPLYHCCFKRRRNAG